MTIEPIRNPLEGEHLLAVSPTPRPAGVNVWHRRLHLYTGRALTHTALQNEQTYRAGRTALLGQSVSAGVVTGLECDLEANEGFLNIAAGRGRTIAGEDVTLPVAVRVSLSRLPVCAPASVLFGDEDPPAEPGGLTRRLIGPSLGELIPLGRPIPQVGIIVLQPVTLTPPTDGAEELCDDPDPNDAAFSDAQLADGVRVLYYAFPTDWMALPAADADPHVWRNRLAAALFAQERTLPVGAVLPWAEEGVPIALLAFNPGWEGLFVDRASVVRAGGKPQRRAGLVPTQGNVFLWQAQIEQMAEHLNDPDFQTRTIQGRAATLRFRPPFGILPKEAAFRSEDNTIVNRFFPASYTIEAVPVPLEQLELATDASAALAPYDNAVPDVVRLLVPVPWQWYEPRLLQTETIDPLFDETIAIYQQRRNHFLSRRRNLRAKLRTLSRAVFGEPIVYPPDDPTAPDNPDVPPEIEQELLPGEAFDLTPFDPIEEAHGVAGAENLDTAPILDESPLLAPTVFPTLFDKVLGLLLVPRQPGETDPQFDQRKAELEGVIKEDLLRGLNPYLEKLNDQINRANDAIDYGFLRTQTDIYRLRKILVGTDQANRLATSTALSSLVKEEQSAYATREQLLSFLDSRREGVRDVGGSAVVGMQPRAFRTFFTPQTVATFVTPQVTEFRTTPQAAAFALPGAFQTERITIGGGLGEIGEIGGGRNIGSGKLAFESKVGATVFDRGLRGEGILFDPDNFGLPDIEEQMAVIGLPMELRTTTIAERFTSTSAEESRTTTAASNLEVVQSLQRVDGIFDHIRVPIVRRYGQRREIERDFRAVGGIGGLDDILPAEVPNADEVDYFALGVDTIDQVVASLRLAEGQVKRYRSALAEVQKARLTLLGFIEKADQRLQTINDDLAEARHDVAVATALRDEEQGRLDRINLRRAEILRTHVTFVAYQRPRHADPVVTPPVRPIYPGLLPATIPACLDVNRAVPPELDAMVDLFRDVPLRWFVNLPPLLQKLDRVELLQETLFTAKRRAIAPVRDRSAVVVNTNATTLYGNAIRNTFTFQQQTLSAQLVNIATLDLTPSRGWRDLHELVADNATLGDLLEAGHGRSDVVQRAIKELDDMAQVATCLYEAMGDLPPLVRLRWADDLSQFDTPLDLRNLANLEAWESVEYRDRRRLQEMVDWIHRAVNAQIPQAVALANDLVRVCFLLASHAPVNQLITARVKRPAKLQPGIRLDLDLTLNRATIGMKVQIYDKLEPGRVVAHAVVEDLSPNGVFARVTRSNNLTAEVDGTTVVHLLRG